MAIQDAVWPMTKACKGFLWGHTSQHTSQKSRPPYLCPEPISSFLWWMQPPAFVSAFQPFDQIPSPILEETIATLPRVCQTEVLCLLLDRLVQAIPGYQPFGTRLSLTEVFPMICTVYTFGDPIAKRGNLHTDKFSNANS
jgi:hypothetical protein